MVKHLFSARAKQKGVALLAALILIMALTLILGNIFYRHQIDVARLTKMLHSDQAMLMALSVESWAGQLLSPPADDKGYDGLDERWAVAVPILPLDGGFIRGCIIDLQAKINLNSFSDYDSTLWNQQMSNNGNGLASSWLSLLTMLDLPSDQAMVVPIIDWIDTNTVTMNQFGAEQINYDAKRSPLIVPDSLLSDASELSIIQGYSLASYHQLEPYIVTLPRPTPININTASEDILLAISSSYGSAFADYILNGRPFFNLVDFQQGLSTFLGLNITDTTVLWPDNLISVKSNYFQLNLEVSLGDARLEIQSIIDRYNLDKPRIIKRSVSVIPEILPNSISANDDQAKLDFCQT